MVKYIEPADLAAKFILNDKKILILDVRDSDYEVNKQIFILFDLF